VALLAETIKLGISSLNDLRPLVLIGGGGHASVLADILLEQGRVIAAVISPEDPALRSVFAGLTHFNNDEAVTRFSRDSVNLINGIGMVPRSNLRREVNQKFVNLGYEFETVISNDASVSNYAAISPGAQVLSGARVQAGARILEHTIVNTGALVEHDCLVGSYSHIAPRATLCGQVKTGAQVFIGAGAIILPGIELGQNSVVGAGTTVCRNVPERALVVAERALKH
jgi:sugar O-acyltransferase (sialic acid O-acetyltransferase NeuD family)